MTILDTDERTKRQSGHQTRSVDVWTALLPSAIKSLLMVFLTSMAASCLFAFQFSVERQVPVIAASIMAVMCGIALLFLPQHRHSAFGYANLVTAVRAGATSLVAAIVLFSEIFASSGTEALTWAVFAIVAAALALDGFDGYLARRFGQESDFGAKFDMEVDAFLIFILSCAVLVVGKAGPWVLLIGAMRYLFVMAQWAVPALTRPLEPSFRRKLICVIQVLALGSALVPLVSPAVSFWLCSVALACLSYSFAVDVVTLMVKRGGSIRTS